MRRATVASIAGSMGGDMGQGHRYFVFEDSGELRPLTHETYQRLHDGETTWSEGGMQ